MIEHLHNMFKEKPKKKAKGKDINLNLTIEFMESVLGANKRVKFTRQQTCQSCNGSKKNKHDSGKRCKFCYGRGFVILDLGFAKFEQACGKCMGTGSAHKNKNKCNCCKGSGVTAVESYENVKIPPGIDSGYKLKVQSKGHVSDNGGVQGDLYVKVSVLAHKVFKRLGNDLFADVFITLPQAVLGGLVEVLALDGNLNLKIEPGVQSGTEVRLLGLGVADFPRNLYEKGDLVYTVYVKSPKVLSVRQRMLYEELERAG
jgi:molecular chaperone DnaJ